MTDPVIEKLETLLKRSYLKRSRFKYSRSRKPLETDHEIVIYAHDLDGCPLANIRNRLHPKPRLYRADFDRGDAFETGFGVVHGLPAGIEIETSLNDYADIARMANGKIIYLKGTPDFLAVINNDLRILDGKSPRRRTQNDGLKGYRVSRLQTYAFLARRLRQKNPEEASKIVYKARAQTPRPVDPAFVGERTTGVIHTAVIVDDPSIRSYRIIEVDQNDDAVIARVKRFLLTYRELQKPNTNRETIKDLIAEAREEFEREKKRMCKYCERIRCPFSEAYAYILEGWTVDGPYESKSKTFYRKLKRNGGRARVRDQESECRRETDIDFLLTSKPDLVRYLEAGRRVVVKTDDEKRISNRMPARPEFVEDDRLCRGS